MPIRKHGDKLPRYIRLFDGRGWERGDMGDLRQAICDLRPKIEETLRKKLPAADPGILPRARVLLLGVGPKQGVTKEAYEDWDKSLYEVKDLRPRFRPYGELLEELGWMVEIRYEAGYGQTGLNVYVMDPNLFPGRRPHMQN
jgi:hypothetical protein